MTSIYILVDPRFPNGDARHIRYVGVTKQKFYVRLSQHISDARSPVNYREWWIKGLVSKGLRPLMVEVERLSTYAEALEAEKFWIVQFRVWGFRLTNLTDGGEGVIDSTGRLAAAARARMTPEIRKFHSDKAKKQWADPVMRARMQNKPPTRKVGCRNKFVKHQGHVVEYRRHLAKSRTPVGSKEFSEMMRSQALKQWSSKDVKEKLIQTLKSKWSTATDRREKASSDAKVQVVSQWQDPAFAEKALSALRGARIKSQRRCVHLETGLVFDSLKDAALFVGYGKKMTHLVLLRWGIRYARDFE